jgi:hypothetical protein
MSQSVSSSSELAANPTDLSILTIKRAVKLRGFYKRYVYIYYIRRALDGDTTKVVVRKAVVDKSAFLTRGKGLENYLVHAGEYDYTMLFCIPHLNWVLSRYVSNYIQTGRICTCDYTISLNNWTGLLKFSMNANMPLFKHYLQCYAINLMHIEDYGRFHQLVKNYDLPILQDLLFSAMLSDPHEVIDFTGAEAGINQYCERAGLVKMDYVKEKAGEKYLSLKKSVHQQENTVDEVETNLPSIEDVYATDSDIKEGDIHVNKVEIDDDEKSIKKFIARHSRFFNIAQIYLQEDEPDPEFEAESKQLKKKLSEDFKAKLLKRVPVDNEFDSLENIYASEDEENAFSLKLGQEETKSENDDESTGGTKKRKDSQSPEKEKKKAKKELEEDFPFTQRSLTEEQKKAKKKDAIVVEDDEDDLLLA